MDEVYASVREFENYHKVFILCPLTVSAYKIGEIEKARKWLAQAFQAISAAAKEDSADITFPLLVILGSIENTTDSSYDASLVEQLEQIAKGIENADNRVTTLLSIAKSAMKIGELEQARKLLEQARRTTHEKNYAGFNYRAVDDIDDLTLNICQSTARVGNWREAYFIIDDFDDNDYKVKALTSIIDIWIEQKNRKIQ